MTLAEHIGELRRRLIRAFLAVTLGAIVAWIFFTPIFRFLTHPYCALPVSHRLGGTTCTLIVTGVLDAFTIRLKVSLIVGVVASAPIWLYQLWAFVAPGLHRHERRWAVAFAVGSAGLFALGATFAYATLGRGLAFLLGFAQGFLPLISVDRYLSFVTLMLLVFGVSFEFPLLILLLNLSGVVSAKRLVGWRRMEIFLVFVFAAVATPSQDPFTMTAMALPMTLLYEVAVLLAKAHDRRAARRAAASPYAGLADDELSPIDTDAGVDLLR